MITELEEAVQKYLKENLKVVIEAKRDFDSIPFMLMFKHLFVMNKFLILKLTSMLKMHMGVECVEGVK